MAGTTPAELAVVFLVVGATIWLHLFIPGIVPSGPDGGNWLAMAQDRFLGLDVMAAAVTYPPLLPLALAALLLVMEPLSALVTMALLSKCLLVIAVYVCARSMGRSYAAAAAVLVGVAGAQLEAYSWGAYPQLLGTAFGIMSVFCAVRFLASREMAYLIGAGVLAILTYATHTLIGGLLVFAGPIAIVHQLWLARSNRDDRLLGIRVAAALAVPGALLAVNNQVLNRQPGVQPVLNPLSLDKAESLMQTISDAPLPWVVVAVFGVASLLIKRWEGDRSVTAATASAWAVVGVLFFLLVGEPRALLLTQFGLIVLALLFLQRLVDITRSTKPKRWRGASSVAMRVIVVLAVATASALVVGGVDSYAKATDWYRVVDYPEIRALDFLKDTAKAGDLVVASEGHHGNQIGWWVQGYAGIPTYTGVDLRFLTFPEEREQSQIANDFFDLDSTEAESRELLRTIGADFVVVDRRGPDAGWLESRLAAELELIYESPTLVLLQVPH
ncbi:MAG TPA: hypothetical protein VLA91_05530 [Acidimicrobiia bacterium]|nr:hypothetical protein [Acidimicrobiia bacterium]